MSAKQVLEEDNQSSEKMSPIDAINEFYTLKNKYESLYYNKYVKPIVDKYSSKKEKRMEYSKLPKHECVNCRRNVGTTFSITYNNERHLRTFIAKCGDVQDPCPLDIQINYAIREPIEELIRDVLGDIERLKKSIIIEKNNAVFFGKDVTSTFEELTEDLKTRSNLSGYIIETNILRNHNPEKKELIKMKLDEFGKGLLLPFKEMIKNYNETNNELKLNEAINFYIHEMKPKLNELLELKYDVSVVEYNEETKIYKLIEMPISTENLEYGAEADDSVVSFVKGVKENAVVTDNAPVVKKKKLKPEKEKKEKPKKTEKDKKEKKPSKSKTKKAKLVIEKDDLFDTPEELVEPEVEERSPERSAEEISVGSDPFGFKELDDKTTKNKNLNEKLVLVEATEVGQSST